MKKIGGRIDKKLVSNTFFLYLLTFSTHLISLVTVPYLTRVLGPVIFGKNGIALAYTSYVAIIMDLGFILSATQKVVSHKKDKAYIGKLIFSVAVAKAVIAILLAGGFVIYLYCNDAMREDFVFYLLYVIAYLVNAFLPDFYYRGIEKMRTITYRTLAVKSFFALMIFIFVKKAEDFWMIPLVTLVGNVAAVAVMYVDLWRQYGVRVLVASAGEVWRHVKDTLPFFVSRIASTVYQALNTIILSFIYGTTAVVGYYSSADKVVSLSKTASSPLADSLYPYMLRKKDFRLVKKFLALVMPIILVGAVVLFVFAEPICIVLFGGEYAATGNILRYLIPIMVVILPTYVLCFPVMVPLGLARHANLSNVIGMCVQIVGLVSLALMHQLNVYSLCLLSSFTEVTVFMYRAMIVFLNRSKLKASE